MIVKCEIPVKKIDGNATDVPRPSLNIESHWPYYQIVDLSFADGPKITVSGRQLIEAVRNAMNVRD